MNFMRYSCSYIHAIVFRDGWIEAFVKFSEGKKTQAANYTEIQETADVEKDKNVSSFSRDG